MLLVYEKIDFVSLKNEGRVKEGRVPCSFKPQLDPNAH